MHRNRNVGLWTACAHANGAVDFVTTGFIVFLNSDQTMDS